MAAPTSPSQDSATASEAREVWPRAAWLSLGLLRIALGLVFLWAFVDKLLGLTYATPSGKAWVHGGSPTFGYLSSSFGPLGDLFKALAGNAVVDVLFMAGLLGVGVALTSGVATRLGCWSGLAMVVLMYASHPVPWASPHTPHPFLDEHTTEMAAFLLLAFLPAGEPLGFGAWWRRAVPVAWLR